MCIRDSASTYAKSLYTGESITASFPDADINYWLEAVSYTHLYHGFMLGLCALLGGAFGTSNRESGDGRYDIQLNPTKKGLPGIRIELKAEMNCSDEQLKRLSETSLQQIKDRKSTRLNSSHSDRSRMPSSA